MLAGVQQICDAEAKVLSPLILRVSVWKLGNTRAAGHSRKGIIPNRSAVYDTQSLIL